MGDPVAELKKLLAVKDAHILALNAELAAKDRELAELRSQLDKFQSVFSACGPASPKILNKKDEDKVRKRKQRAGISAEPQNEKSVLELSKKTFQTYEKDEA